MTAETGRSFTEKNISEEVSTLTVPIGGEASRAADRLVSTACWKTRLKRLLWAAVEATLFRWSFHTMNRWRCFLLRCFGAMIGPACIVRRTARIYYPWNLHIGALCVIGDEVRLYSVGKITLGQRVMVSQEAYLCAATHNYRDAGMPLVKAPVEVAADAWICARAFVGPGVKVGEGAILSACGVAMKDLPAWTIVGGNPAVFIKARPRLKQT